MLRNLFRRPLRASRSLSLPAVLALLVGVVHAGVAAQQVLTLEAAVQLAQQRSQQLVAQDAAAASARDMAHSAGQLPDPVLKGGISNLPLSGPDRFSLTRDFMTQRSIGVMQEFTRAGKRQARSARFARDAEMAEALRALALAALRRDAATAWLDRYFQQRVRDMLSEQRTESTLLIEAADVAYRSGRGMQTDLFATRYATAQIDERIRQTEQMIATATTRLQRWIGAAASEAMAELPAMTAARLNEQDMDAELARHPQIVVMRRQEDLAHADAQVAQSDKETDWSVEWMFSQRGPAYSNMASVTFSLPLQLDQKNRQDRVLLAKLALVSQARAQREELARELMAETRGWLQQWQGNRDRLALYDATLNRLAAERTRAALASYRGGNGPIAAVLESRGMEIATRLERLRLEMETAALWARLEYLIPPQPEQDTLRPASISGRAP